MADQDDLPPEYNELPRERLKHGTGRFKDVVLVPQPSDSPNDPLNVSAVVCVNGYVVCLTQNADNERCDSGPNGTVFPTTNRDWCTL